MPVMMMGVNFHGSHPKHFLLSSKRVLHIETELMIDSFSPVLGDRVPL
jgi:hypothetical protein